MHSESRLRRVTALVIAVMGTVSVSAHGQPPPASSSTSPPGSVLPHNVIVALGVVNRFFPEVTQQASSGQNLTAVGKPKATRSVIYANNDSSKKVTITVDQYARSSDASAAYHEAVEKSRIVPGFKPISAPDLSQNAFIGTVTQGAETHLGIGALDGTRIVGVTLAGYEPTPDNVAKLISLSRKEEAASKAAPDRNTRK
jgi:hypothetical protein